MALVDGRRSLKDICAVSARGSTETLTRMAQLKLAGIITQTTSPQQVQDRALESMVGDLSTLLENYLTERSSGAAPASRVKTTVMENLGSENFNSVNLDSGTLNSENLE